MHPLPVERPEEGHTLAVAQICYDVYNPPNIESQNEIRQDWNLGCGHHEHDHKQDNGNQQRVRNAPAAQGYHQKPSRAKEDSPLLVAGPPKYLTFIHTEFMV